MYLNIKENAIFIADAHFNTKRGELASFLNLLENNVIVTPQLILMGDIFDFLTQESFYFIEQNHLLINRLNALSLKIEMIYLEGNHDYNLEKLFPNMLVVSRNQQPLIAQYNQQEMALSHGDNFTNTSYNFYCQVIRNKPLLKFLNAIDVNHWLSKKIDASLKQKNICHSFTGFKSFVEKRLTHYRSKIVVEGHYHQGKEFTVHGTRYVNIPSLFCSKEYMVLAQNTFTIMNIDTH